jgi:TPR repeat protein
MHDKNLALVPLLTFCFGTALLFLATFTQAAQLDKLLEQAENGSVKAQTDLGVVYELGKGTQKDPQKAATWYKKAAEQGYARAQTNLGNLYETGTGVSVNYREALTWYQKAAEQDYARAQTYLGRLYEYGRGVAKDLPMAATWYRKAAEQGSARAQTNLGSLYRDGVGGEIDYAAAIKWYEMAAEQGYARAQTYLAQMYEQGLGAEKDLQQAVKLYKSAAAQGYRKASIQLNRLEEQLAKDQTETKKQPVEIRPAEPVDLPVSAEPEVAASDIQKEQKTKHALLPENPYVQAAKSGDPKAQNKLALLYLNGDQGFKQDEEKAIYWFQKAAALGNVDAQNNLGLMYLNSQSIEKDYQQAAFWLLQAAEQGNVAAQSNLGLMFFYGQGVEQDYQQAAFWLLKAAKKGYATAQNNLATLYADGLGVEKNTDRAIYWLRKAAEQGDETARKNLTKLILDIQESPVRDQQSTKDESSSMAYSSTEDNQAPETSLTNSMPADPAVPAAINAREYFHKGNLYAKDGQFELAISEYKQAIALDSNNSNTYENLAISYAKNGNFTAAVETMQNAIQLSPDDAMKYATLGIIYHADMQLSQALVQYRSSLRINPGLSEIYYNMATIYIEQEQFEKAQQAAYLAQNLGFPGSSKILTELEKTAPSSSGDLDLGKASLHLRHIVTSSEEEAQKVLGLLREGKDFSQLAEKFSIQPFNLNGGYIGPFVTGELMQEIATVVELLPPFTYSPVIATDNGFHVFQRFLVFNNLLASY